MEETRLLEGIQQSAGYALVSTYETLLKEHREIERGWLSLKGHVAETADRISLPPCMGI
jgi:hypothetical protein